MSDQAPLSPEEVEQAKAQLAIWPGKSWCYRWAARLLSSLEAAQRERDAITRYGLDSEKPNPMTV